MDPRHGATRCSAQVTRIDESSERGVLSFDVIAETLRATNLGLLQPGSHANFERWASPEPQHLNPRSSNEQCVMLTLEHSHEPLRASDPALVQCSSRASSEKIPLPSPSPASDSIVGKKSSRVFPLPGYAPAAHAIFIRGPKLAAPQVGADGG